jgi:glycosyltransferase involved in cell wall biosynthesis
MIDIFITTYKREEVFKQSLKSLLESTNRDLFRLTVVVDGGGSDFSARDYVFQNADYVLWNHKNIGVGPSVNNVLSHIGSLNDYFDNSQKNFICYCQDDVVYEKGWLEKLIKIYSLFSRKYDIGFVSGHNAPEHATKEKIKFGKDELLLKPWIRATNMFAEREYFLSMLPIARIDPETRRERAKPNDGIGSGIDWWFIRNHPNSVCKSGKINLVYPGLIKHIGYNKSTWHENELPEDV